MVFIALTLALPACNNANQQKSEKIASPTAKETMNDDIIAIDILLDPDSTMLNASKIYNDRMLENYPDGFALDESHRPHISVVQAFVHTGDLSKIEGDLKNILSGSDLANTELTANGLYYIPFEDKGVAGITVEKNKLESFQSQIAEMMQKYTVANGTGDAFVPNPDGKPTMQPTVDYVNAFVSQASGDKYNPHVTIGAAYQKYVDELLAQPFKEFSFQVKSVSIYQLGELGTAQKKLARVAL